MMVRARGVLASVGVLAAMACGTTALTTPPTIGFVSPTQGENLTAANGTVNSSDTQLTVTVILSTSATPGSAVTLDVDSAPQGGSQAVSAAGQVSFTGITLSGNANGLTHNLAASVTDSSTQLSNQATVSVTVTLTGQSSNGCTLAISPATATVFNETGNAVTGHSVVADTALSTPGMQANLTVTGSAGCNGQAVTLTVGNTAQTPVTMTNGTAAFSGITLPDTPVAAFLGTAADELAVTASVGTGSTASTASVAYLVDSVNPTLTVTSLVAGHTYGTSDDVDPNKPGLQLDVTGSSAALANWVDAGAPITVAVDVSGASEGTGPVTAGGSFTVETTVPNGTGEPVVASATTPSGNVGSSASISISADAVPAISIISPTSGKVLNSSYGIFDGGVSISVQVSTTADIGSTLIVCSTVAGPGEETPCPVSGGGYEVGSGSVSAATSQVSALLSDDGANPNQVITVYVEDNGATASNAVTIQIHIGLPVIASVDLPGAYDGGGVLWWNASFLDAGGNAAGVVVVTLGGTDTYFLSDGGAASSVTVSTNTGVSANAPVELVSGTPTAVIPLSLGDDGYTLTVAASDPWSNPSATPNPTVALSVKTALPSCALQSSVSGAYWNVADNGAASAGSVPVSVQVTFANANGEDANLTPIDGTASVSANGTQGASGATTATPLTLKVTSPQGLDAYTATVTDPAGNPPANCSGGFSLTVDTVTPTVSVAINSDPTTPSSVDGGVQIYSTTRTVTGTVSVGSTIPVGATVVVSLDGGSPQDVTVVSGGGTSGANGASFSFSNAPNGTLNVVASATDSAGNVGTGYFPVIIDGAALGCDLTLASPGETPLTGGGDAVIFNTSAPSVTFTTSCAVGTDVTFTTTPSGGSPQSSQPTPTVASGSGSGSMVTFTLAGLSDGASGTLAASIAGGVSLSPINYDVKLSKPSIGSTTPGLSTLTIVAFQDNPYAGTDGGPAGTNGFVLANGENDTNAAYVTFSASAISGLGPAVNGNIGTVTLSNGSRVLGSQTLTTGETTATFTNAALPADNYPTPTTVTMTVADNAGNTVTQSWSVLTDVVPPTAPTVSAAMADKRKASVLLSWTVPSTPGGTAIAGYEDRYTSTYLTSAAPTTVSEAVYPTWTQDTAISGVTGIAAGQPATSTATGLPPFDQYTFEVRSIDAVGNRSALVAPVTVTSLAAGVANSWQELHITGPDGSISGGGSVFGYVVKSGHFTSGNYRDLVITAPMAFAASPMPGVVYVLYGSGSYANAPTSYSGMQALQIGTTGNADFMGFAVAVGDFNGDGIDDLAVGSPEYNSGQGRVDIFFGTGTGLCAGAMTCTSPSVTILGPGSPTGLFGHGVSAIGDINSDGVQDLLVGAPADGASGTAYLYLGAKTWAASPTATTKMTSDVTGDGVGARWGSVGIGSLDGSPDFSVSAPGGGNAGGSGTVYFVSGKTALANATIDLSTVQNQLLPPLTVDVPCSSDTNYTGGVQQYLCFGTYSIGDVSYTGATLPDFISSTQQLAGEFLFPMKYPAGAQASAFSDTQGNGQGISMVSVDLNGNGTPDLIAGVNDNVGDTGYVAGAFIYLDTGAGLASPAQAVIPPDPTYNINGDFFGFGAWADTLRGNGSGVDVIVTDVFPNSNLTIYY